MTSSRTSSTTTAPAVLRSASCPADNLKTYTGADGSTYQIQCDTDYNPGSRGDTIRRVTTFQQCVDACVAFGNACQASSFVPGRVGDNCYLKQSTLYKQAVNIVVHSIRRLTNAIAKRQDETFASTTSVAIEAGSTFTSDDLTGIADKSVDYGNAAYDTDAIAAAEAAFQVQDITNSTSSGSSTFVLPSVNDTIAASQNASIQLAASANNPSSNSTAAILDSSVDTTWTSLSDTTRSIMLMATTSGNLNLAAHTNISSENPQTSLLFSSASGDGVITSDYASRSFVYFPASIASYNASRLRLVDDPYIPRGSRIVTLTPLNIGGGAVYVAADTEGNMMQLAWCDVEGGAPKVFVVTGPEGVAALEMEEVRWSITGGVVNECQALTLATEMVDGLDVGIGGGGWKSDVKVVHVSYTGWLLV
ncbi:hypothetical protein CLAFUW4_10433 [Fulvia fulva]|uniref:Apple domain-containing protein n=1 Tax=Passalora fulva TaxID=5499 RepID=A0A9Q8P786_PASFU|nr:uncharacterized protein CLAFUR5_05048 [Fulvia fulva]KAK4616079.1 hypothetical protein CLAFUR4_10437 [Fulvia fulva]KAK4617352.1 hypothetical protein CLAFUR0_10438 [Fulvia fulva]UJO15793.1 hypothetical protein CLAFUR5_05048 [Fulvia fulva]WPV19553.1 hypothetical protein CLAFUW4_10433 [Fulvia fulva]WPV33696.1 hypothetical protein CLAFUW7_10433 [Fulvia fulva]